jgi:beta-aspartyl-peptidase (threonine type)
MPSKNTWSLIAHGGAKTIKPHDERSNRGGLLKALHMGSDILSKGGSAIDAVEEVVKQLERDPAYNAGLYGCVTNEEGKTELTASIMDGATLDIGAVAALENIEHPVSVAKALLQDRAIFLAGAGAMKFAQAQGFQQVDAPPCEASDGCDTVGCVALDMHGNVAAATSTAGLKGTRAGRVGDVPLPGCGFYADNARGGISCSGDGEMIARVMVASEFLHFLEESGPDDAAKRAIKLLDKVNGEAGLIAIDTAGNTIWAHNSPHFAVGMTSSENPDLKVYLKKSEENAS